MGIVQCQTRAEDDVIFKGSEGIIAAGVVRIFCDQAEVRIAFDYAKEGMLNSGDGADIILFFKRKIALIKATDDFSFP